jgi:hypothetical protein
LELRTLITILLLVELVCPLAPAPLKYHSTGP